MSSLPAPQPRRPIHTRRIAFEGFLRDDGLWDIDCELVDAKAEDMQMHAKQLPAGAPVHHMRIRVTVDDALTIRDIQTVSAAAPFGECQNAAAGPMRKLVGLTMGPGWRKTIEGAIGGTAGCTHLRELVFNAATAAFQMIPGYKARQQGAERPVLEKPPFFMGQCMAWAFDGPVVQRYAPQFYRGITKAG
jgi:hypothetical protein